MGDERSDAERLAAIREAMTEHGGCGDNSCRIAKPCGMATNGGCRCADTAGNYEREQKLRRLIAALSSAVGRQDRKRVST